MIAETKSDLLLGIEAAETVSRYSLDPSKKVGAVLRGHTWARGFNHIPAGIYHPSDPRIAELTRDERLDLTVHAELHLLIDAGKATQGATMFIGATEPDGTPVGIAPCRRCAVHIISAGIAHVVCRQRPAESRWRDEWAESIRMFKKAGIAFVEVGA